MRRLKTLVLVDHQNMVTISKSIQDDNDKIRKGEQRFDLKLLPGEHIKRKLGNDVKAAVQSVWSTD
jgi:hypothetical protein